MGAMIVLVACAQAGGPDIDGAQLGRLISGLHSDLRDLSFVYEGTSRFVGPARLLKGRPTALLESQYQGNFLYRDDNSLFLDIYRRSESIDVPMGRATYALLRDQLEQMEEWPDLKTIPQKRRKGRGTPDDVNPTDSPQRFFLLPFFQQYRGRSLPGYRFLGWEIIEGHKCIKFSISKFENPKIPRKPVETFWVDLDRGGHPLRIEWHEGEDLLMLTHGVELQQFKVQEGEDLWLPISAIHESFMWDTDFFKEPIFQQSFRLLRSSLRINQGIPDQSFTLDARDLVPGSGLLSRDRREFDVARKKSLASSSHGRTDAAGVQARLDTALAEADRQSEMLNASSPAREGWSLRVLFWPLLLGLASVALLATVGYLRWRMRARGEV